MVIALIVTRDGYPLGYEVFDGNTADVTTVEEIVNKVEAQHGQASRIWVMDRGSTSEANLEFIRRRGGRYILGTPKAQMARFAGQITEEGWQDVREGIEVKRIANPRGDCSDYYLLCRSQDRAAKEQSMLQRFERRMEAVLEALARSAQTGRLCEMALAQQQRVLQQRVEYLMRHQVAGPPTAAATALQAGAVQAVDPQPWLTALEHTPAAAPPPNDAEPPVA